MTLEIFISILVISATATSLAIEIIKAILNNLNVKYNKLIVATIASFIIGLAEIFIYYISKSYDITTITFVYAICMGLANMIASQLGYDKTKEFILALFQNK